MKNKKVLVVLGGTSGERKVSLDSGRACKTFLLSFISPVVDYFSGISHSLLSG